MGKPTLIDLSANTVWKIICIYHSSSDLEIYSKMTGIDPKNKDYSFM